MLTLLGIPRNLSSQLTPGVRCEARLDIYDQLFALLGIPGVLVVIYFTAKLLQAMHARKRGSRKASKDNVVVSSVCVNNKILSNFES